jgi:hypothetical protein
VRHLHGGAQITRGGDDGDVAATEACAVLYRKVRQMFRSMTSPTTRIAPLDAALAAFFVAVSVAFMIASVDDEGGSWAAVPVFTLVAVPLLWRRMAPLHALAGLAGAVGLHVALFGTITRCGLFLPVDFLLVFAAAVRLPWRMAVVGLGLGIGGAILMLGFDQSASLQDAGVFAAALVTGVWVVGIVVRTLHTRMVAAPAQLEPAGI